MSVFRTVSEIFSVKE